MPEDIQHTEEEQRLLSILHTHEQHIGVFFQELHEELLDWYRGSIERDDALRAKQDEQFRANANLQEQLSALQKRDMEKEVLLNALKIALSETKEKADAAMMLAKEAVTTSKQVMTLSESTFRLATASHAIVTGAEQHVRIPYTFLEKKQGK